jgi:hypothetical protein
MAQRRDGVGRMTGFQQRLAFEFIKIRIVGLGLNEAFNLGQC